MTASVTAPANPSYDDLWDAWAASEHEAYTRMTASMSGSNPTDSRLLSLRAMSDGRSVESERPGRCKRPGRSDQTNLVGGT